MRFVIGGLVLGLLCFSGCAKAGDQKQKPKQEPGMSGMKTAVLTVTSSAFGPGQPIPVKYTGEGQNISPPLTWFGAPEGTREFALICDDPDAPRAEPWVHWVLYKVPPGVTALAEGGHGGAVEGNNSAGRTGYQGPMPPPGHGTHHYHFKVYALDATLELAPGATKEKLLDAMRLHVIAEGELIGTYER